MDNLNKDDSSDPLLVSPANPRSPDPENRDFDSPNEEQQQQQQQQQQELEGERQQRERERQQREREDAEKRSKEEEKEMNEALDSGDFEEIMKRITPQKLTECTTNCIEKSFEVSHRLKTLGKSKGPKAEEFNNLATQVEDFAFKLVEPLKNDDVKRAIFKEHCFDSVSDKALKYQQKKYVSHPLYDLMMRQRWMGDFYQLKYSNVKKTLLKWFLINIWTFFDVFLFPLVHVLLLLPHLIIEFAKKRQGLSVGFIFSDSWKSKKLQRAADDFEKKLRSKIEVNRVKVEEVISSEGEIKLYGKKKVLLAMTTGVRHGAPSNQLLEAVTLLKKKQKCKVISVGYVDGIHLNHHCTHFKYLETMATNDGNVFLIFDGDKDKNTVLLEDILTCIKGKDIYDRYVQYFKTPYFIFFRETLSYLALLGLHFAMCLQPSTLHFTAVEWIISVFFLGRLMMEINQIIAEQEAKETQKKLWKVMSAYFHDWWNILDIFTLIVFLVLVGLRAFIWSQHSFISKNRLLAVVGYLYGLNAMFLTLRVFGHIMEYKESTGSIQIALFRIIRAVIIIFGQFVATTLAFSFAVTKIYIAEVSYSSGKNGTSIGFCKSQSGLECWWGFTRHLSWSLLGIADLTPLQSSDETSDLLAKILYGLFLIMGVVMLMNMMIALLSSTYQQVQNNAFYEWSYKKATTIRTYSKYHSVPVPFNIISLSFILLRHIYRTVTSTTCCNPQKERTHKEKMLWYRLQIEYFAKYGQKFLKTETEGNRKMIGYIAERAFLYDPKETQQPNQRNRQGNVWEAKGIAIIGQRLEYAGAFCSKCREHGKVDSHTARYLSPLSKECPEFEVLIKEIGEKRMIAIGVVTAKDHNTHKLPGWEENTVGYHIDNGKIFDTGDNHYGTSGVDAMAYRGDIIGCRILYDKEEDGKLPVSFTLNNRVVGEAKVDAIHENHPGPFYPCVGIGSKGISLVFRLCPRTETDPVFQNDDISEQQSELLSNTPSTNIDSVIQMFLKNQKTISEKFEMIIKRQTELERKIDHLSRTG